MKYYHTATFVFLLGCITKKNHATQKTDSMVPLSKKKYLFLNTTNRHAVPRAAGEHVIREAVEVQSLDVYTFNRT